MFIWYSLLEWVFWSQPHRTEVRSITAWLSGSRPTTISLFQVFGITLSLVSRIQVSQKFKEARDCFGHLPSLLNKSSVLNFRTCGIREKHGLWNHSELRSVPTANIYYLETLLLLTKVTGVGHGVLGTCRHCTGKSVCITSFVPWNNPEERTVSSF